MWSYTVSSFLHLFSDVFLGLSGITVLPSFLPLSPLSRHSSNQRYFHPGWSDKQSSWQLPPSRHTLYLDGRVHDESPDGPVVQSLSSSCLQRNAEWTQFKSLSASLEQWAVQFTEQGRERWLAAWIHSRRGGTAAAVPLLPSQTSEHVDHSTTAVPVSVSLFTSHSSCSTNVTGAQASVGH